VLGDGCGMNRIAATITSRLLMIVPPNFIFTAAQFDPRILHR
jgi:hypothetical protein